ncbi:MAG: respiratory chain complex I subunit 1 family protein [Myxococcaceae bacterium]
MNLGLRLALTVLQVALLLALAPLLSGFIKKLKATFQRRVGPPLTQGYRDLAKLLFKENLHAAPTSAIFRLAPAVSLTCALLAAATFPCFVAGGLLPAGDVVTALYLLALGRFFTALAGLDAASAFGGLGSSRDVSIAALAEPVAVVAILALAAGVGGTTDGAALSSVQASFFAPWRLLAGAAFFMVVLAECARVPVDNPATHLELTMVHEAMLLEYSGPELAAATLAAQVKQTVLLAMMATVFFPDGLAASGQGGLIAAGVLTFGLKLFGLAALIAIIETSVAKLRLFRVPDFLGAAAGLAILAYVAREAL